MWSSQTDYLRVFIPCTINLNNKSLFYTIQSIRKTIAEQKTISKLKTEEVTRWNSTSRRYGGTIRRMNWWKGSWNFVFVDEFRWFSGTLDNPYETSMDIPISRKKLSLSQVVWYSNPFCLNLLKSLFFQSLDNSDKLMILWDHTIPFDVYSY